VGGGGGGGAAGEVGGGGRAEAAVRIGERPLVDAERGELLADLLHSGEEDLLAEETRVVEVTRPVVGVGAIAIEERVRPGDACRERRLAALGGEHDGGGARTGSSLERRARSRHERVGGDDERDARAAGG